MKAVIWGSCGSLPFPSTSADIRRKLGEALWDARDCSFQDREDVEQYLDQLAHSARGTYKANTSCVQIITENKDFILCDAGSGLRNFSLSLGKNPPPATYHIFISHLHWDHIQGFPFFAPAYQAGNRIVFHGFHEATESVIREQMRTPLFPVPFESMQAEIEFDIRADGEIFELGDLRIDTIQQEHPGGSWGYRFAEGGKSIIYSTDSEHGPNSNEKDYPFVEFFKNADILIFDAQYSFEEAANEKRFWGHSDHTTAIDLAARAQVNQLVLFHHEPSYGDAKIEGIHKEAIERRSSPSPLSTEESLAYPTQIELAYDGLILEA